MGLDEVATRRRSRGLPPGTRSKPPSLHEPGKGIVYLFRWEAARTTIRDNWSASPVFAATGRQTHHVSEAVTTNHGTLIRSKRAESATGYRATDQQSTAETIADATGDVLPLTLRGCRPDDDSTSDTRVPTKRLRASLHSYNCNRDSTPVSSFPTTAAVRNSSSVRSQIPNTYISNKVIAAVTFTRYEPKQPDSEAFFSYPCFAPDS